MDGRALETRKPRPDPILPEIVEKVRSPLKIFKSCLSLNELKCLKHLTLRRS